MSRTYIAFVECVLNPNGHWSKIVQGIDFEKDMPTESQIYDGWRPSGKDAELDLVDIGGLRRYFKFNNHDAEIRIVGNVVIFDKDDAEELAIDDSAKFPNKKRIDQ